MILPLITQDLLNVPIDVAVELIAEMAGLEVVRRANVFFVTTDETAEKMRRQAAGRGSQGAGSLMGKMMGAVIGAPMEPAAGTPK